MKRIYLAGRYSRIDELNLYATQLREFEFIIDCQWLKGSHQLSDEALTVENATETTPIEGKLFALEDFNDVCHADWVICFTEKPHSGHSRGGRHVEMGLALAWNKRVTVVGPRENIFCCLPQIQHYSNFNELLHNLKSSKNDNCC